jgi:hypothetical protein
MGNAKRLTGLRRTLKFAPALAVTLLLMPGLTGVSWHARAASPTLTLTNATRADLASVTMTAIPPDPDAGPGKTVTRSIPFGPGETITVARPGGDLRLEFTGGDCGFAFPVLRAGREPEQDIEAALVLRKDSVPELRFTDKTRLPLAGDNAAWKFPQILGAFPYGIGVTTKKEAQSRGAKQAPKKTELAAIVPWLGEPWKTLLEFPDDAPESVLRRITMVADDPEGSLAGMFVPDALEERGYGFVFTESQGGQSVAVFASERSRRVFKAVRENDASALRPGDAEAFKEDVVVMKVSAKGQAMLILCRAGEMNAGKTK